MGFRRWQHFYSTKPLHTYTNYGNFTVTLIATNVFGCTDTITRTDYIRIRRAAISIPALPARGCIPFTISPVPVISALDAVTSFEWDFGDGGTSFLPNPTHTYTVQGTYTVRLIITTSTGCRDTLNIPFSVQVGSKPVANFQLPLTRFVQENRFSLLTCQYLQMNGTGILEMAAPPLFRIRCIIIQIPVILRYG